MSWAGLELGLNMRRLWELGLGGTLGDIDPLSKAPLREPRVGLRRVPLKGSPLCYLGGLGLGDSA